jgi:hypothetical protein
LIRHEAHFQEQGWRAIFTCSVRRGQSLDARLLLQLPAPLSSRRFSIFSYWNSALRTHTSPGSYALKPRLKYSVPLPHYSSLHEVVGCCDRPVLQFTQYWRRKLLKKHLVMRSFWRSRYCADRNYGCYLSWHKSSFPSKFLIFSVYVTLYLMRQEHGLRRSIAASRTRLLQMQARSNWIIRYQSLCTPQRQMISLLNS